MQVKYYLVGGAVRDKLLGLKPKDMDYAVECESFEAMVADIESRGGQIFLSKPEFLTVRAKVPQHEVAADYVVCRKESFYSDGRHPDSVSIGTILDDLKRRDFTINAMAQDEKGLIIDPHMGKFDLHRGVLRCVGNTRERFEEDYLRLIRAVRFGITKEFILDDEIESAFSDQKILDGLKNVSRERIFEELKKCFEFSTEHTLVFFDNHQRLKTRLFETKFGIGIKLLPRL